MDSGDSLYFSNDGNLADWRISMEIIHGGDIYRNRIRLDFSVNVNPLGIPGSVKESLRTAVDDCEKYPDILSSGLKKAVGKAINAPDDELLFGNGASEIFMAIVHALRPKRMVIPVPSFYGYEHVSKAVESEILFYRLDAGNGFSADEGLLGTLDGADMLFFTNPNNPTGRLTDRKYIRRLLDVCLKKGVRVVLDECFMPFCGEENSMLGEYGNYPNLMIVRAFTKIFSIPGVRLGYMICSDKKMIEKISSQLPEWNISVFAQKAGEACAKEGGFIRKTVEYIGRERTRLSDGLKGLGIKVFLSDADFLLIYTEIPLYDELLKRGILIRDCKNFRGLEKGYYRIAVKNETDNKELLREVGEIVDKYRIYASKGH